MAASLRDSVRAGAGAGLSLILALGCSGGGGAAPATGTGGRADGGGVAGSGGAPGSGGGGGMTTDGHSGSGGAGAAGAAGGADGGLSGSGGAPGAGSGGASDGGGDAPAGVDSGPEVDPASSPWTGTWASSPQGCGGGFNGRTMREIVHTSIGGSAARVRISNTFSGGQLQLRDVHLAQRTQGASIDPATDKALTFNGQPDVTIPAGMYAVSDGAPFTVKPLSDVAVSFFVIANNGATCHQSGFQTNYSAAGNVVGAATLANTENNTSYFFLSNLDVQNPAAEGAVVALGASITDGYVAPTDANRRWPNDLAVRLVNGNRVVGVLNQGISGDGADNAISRFARDVLSQPNVKWVIFSDNTINDLGNANPPAQTEIDRMKTMIDMAHAKGLKFICSTLTPFAGANYWSPDKEPKRAMIIDFIKSAGSGCDGIVDQDTATHDPANPSHYLPAYNQGDNLHPNTAGLQAIADA
ncbi:MAG TPA: GDSL-type esterase/lipase family protein, partial [Polyangia bacterium]|nr:GDSL-type esterase/lipase family protein [Polyangia bacterium]